MPCTAKVWQGGQDSNLQQLVLETRTLPIELPPSGLQPLAEAIRVLSRQNTEHKEIFGEMMSGSRRTPALLRHDWELLRLAVAAVAAAPTAILAQLEPLAGLLPVFERVVVPSLALRASHGDHHAVFFFRHRRVLGVGAGAPENMKKTDARPVPR
jgi:hypothetical protein